MTTIVCYTGGTCGDLITALIDPTDAVIRPNGSVMHIPERVRLKKPHLFSDDTEKDQYLQSVTHSSVSSHDTDYHIKRQHSFVTVGIRDFSVAVWAATRFKSLHRAEVWAEMQTRCGANSIEDYAQIMMDYTAMVANHGCDIVHLESIINGCAIQEVEHIINRPVIPEAEIFYKNWLEAQQL